MTIGIEKVKRNSTFELLRIIAITFIFCHHTLMSTNLMIYSDSVGVLKMPDKIIGIVLNSIFIIGVDLFILISGYFRIKFSISKIVKLLLMCLVCSLIYIINSDITTIKSIIYDIVHLYSRNPFVPSYIALFLVSPLINKALDTLSFDNFKKIMILLVIVNVFIGFILDYGCVSADGYNLINFMFLYILGAFIRCMPPIKTKKLVGIYIISYICLVIWAFFYKSNFSAFAYNNPFVLLLATSFFLCISKCKIKSKVIDKLASATFAVFLIENFVRREFFPINNSIKINELIINIIADYLILFLLAYLTTILINKFFKYIAPLFEKIDRYFTFK